MVIDFGIGGSGRKAVGGAHVEYELNRELDSGSCCDDEKGE